MNQIEITNQNISEKPWVGKLRRFLRAALKRMRKKNWRVSVLLCDDSAIKELNRTYRGKSVVASNIGDLKMVIDAKKAMKDKPVIVVVQISNPMVFSEFEKDADAILGAFGIQDQALMDIIAGTSEPSGLLPLPFSLRLCTINGCV